MPFAPGVFDGATMIRTLHHMQDPARALAGVREVVTDGGVFILEYANKRNLKAVARWLVRRQGWSPFDHSPVEFARLNFDFHPAAVRGWLSGAMFHVEREVPVSHLRLGWLKRAVPTGALLVVERPLQRLGRTWLFTPSVFVRARATGDLLPPAPFSWRCPDCNGRDLAEGTSDVTCQSCGRAYPFLDGIYDFRLAPGR
jgi:SAM-dependent methyltransferase